MDHLKQPFHILPKAQVSLQKKYSQTSLQTLLGTSSSPPAIITFFHFNGCVKAATQNWSYVIGHWKTKNGDSSCVYFFFWGHLWLWTCPLPVSRFTTDIVGSIQIIWPWNICISATLFRLLAHQTLFSILIHFSEQAGTCSLRWVNITHLIQAPFVCVYVFLARDCEKSAFYSR